MKKVCTKCGQEKDINEFYKNKKRKDGHLTICKPCSDNRYPKICEICGKEFLGKHKTQKFCSIECRGLNDREQIEYNCDYCGKLCKTNRYVFESSKLHYCSFKCMGRGRLGELNPAYKPNKPKERVERKREFHEYYEWRRKVFERDNYTCIITGDNTGGNLVAHHLYSYSTHKHLRVDINNGVTITEDIHKEFHSIYGYKNNTAEQFYEFYKNKTGKDFKMKEVS